MARCFLPSSPPPPHVVRFRKDYFYQGTTPFFHAPGFCGGLKFPLSSGFSLFFPNRQLGKPPFAEKKIFPLPPFSAAVMMCFFPLAVAAAFLPPQCRSHGSLCPDLASPRKGKCSIKCPNFFFLFLPVFFSWPSPSFPPPSDESPPPHRVIFSSWRVPKAVPSCFPSLLLATPPGSPSLPSV